MAHAAYNICKIANLAKLFAAVEALYRTGHREWNVRHFYDRERKPVAEHRLRDSGISAIGLRPVDAQRGSKPRTFLERKKSMIEKPRRVVAMLCMLSFTSMLTTTGAASALPVADVPVASASADTSTSTAGVCALNSWANGSTYAGISTTPCWVILIAVGAICAGCVGTVLNPVPGDEIIVCEACLTAILAAEAEGCFE